MTLDGVSPMADLRKENGREEPWNVKYFGVGNENWGCGGQMTPEKCAREYSRYATVCHNLDPKNLKLVMCGANGHDIEWTRRIMKEWIDLPAIPEGVETLKICKEHSVKLYALTNYADKEFAYACEQHDFF